MCKTVLRFILLVLFYRVNSRVITKLVQNDLYGGVTSPALSWSGNDCGMNQYGDSPVHRLSRRIIGGTASRKNEWPWLVSLMFRSPGSTNETFGHLCGGVLIQPQWVVSTAHCFDARSRADLTTNPVAWRVRVGEHDLFDEGKDHVDVDPELIIKHPQYYQSWDHRLHNDIALVKLSRPVALGSTVQAACVPEGRDLPVGTVCLAAGWGYTRQGGSISPVVQHVEMPILSTILCQLEYYNGSTVDTILCAGHPGGGKDTCQYDSGGPLMCVHDGRWFVHGLTSFGRGCAQPETPGVYTKLTSYTHWIQSVISNYT